MSAKELYKELKALAKDQNREDFQYKNGRSLGQRLGHIEVNLGTVVLLKVRHDKHKKQKHYTFWPKEDVGKPTLAGMAEFGGIGVASDSADASAF